VNAFHCEFRVRLRSELSYIQSIWCNQPTSVNPTCTKWSRTEVKWREARFKLVQGTQQWSSTWTDSCALSLFPAPKRLRRRHRIHTAEPPAQMLEGGGNMILHRTSELREPIPDDARHTGGVTSSHPSSLHPSFGSPGWWKGGWPRCKVTEPLQYVARCDPLGKLVSHVVFY